MAIGSVTASVSAFRKRLGDTGKSQVPIFDIKLEHGLFKSYSAGRQRHRMTARFAFLLTRDFTLSPLSLFLDTLRLAGDDGDRSRRVAFDWQIVGERGLPIRSSCSVDILPTQALGRPEDYDHIVVVGGLLKVGDGLSTDKQDFLMHAAKLGLPITGLCTASFLLARHGLLDDYRACVSWFHINDFRASFPNVYAGADSLYTIDRDRATCAGGTGAADLASYFVTRYLGDRAARKAANILVLDRIRSVRDPQPVGDLFPKATSRLIKRALLIMESNLQQKLSVTEIAGRMQVSRRQLERLFSVELGISPLAAYTSLRVNSAKTLLNASDLQVAEIGYRCGFVNPGHFSRVFRRHTGYSPSASRYGSETTEDATDPVAVAQASKIKNREEAKAR
ncbi:MAG: AraC family transcriptional regulator [Mesorhizobium sp. 61-13]|nr:MAG: AraC family transcriptional regulator [Mesorhizobium sp. 61-13]